MNGSFFQNKGPLQVWSNVWTSAPSVFNLFSGGGAMMLDKLSVSGRPTNLENSRAMQYCACSKWG